jgi:spore coat protein U-like protein
MMRRLIAVGALLVVLCAHRATAQQCPQGHLTINGPLNFGPYTGAQIRSTTTYTITCPVGGAWSFPFNLTGTDTANLRHLAGPGGATLGYTIYRDSAYSQVWGNTTNNQMTGNGTTNGTIYAQLNANQTAANGGYTETVSSNTQSLQLTAQINPTCSISANALTFPNYAGALVTGSTTLSVSCTNTTWYNVGLNAGTGSGGSDTNPRMMTGPGGRHLKYSLFSDSGRTTNWGNSAPNWVFGIGTGSAQTLTVYGQIPANQNTISGTYTDTIIATVNY